MRARRVTIQDIANHVGMSIGMVSSVLGRKSYCTASDSTRELIESAADELGYRPNLLARSLKDGRSHIVGFICESAQNEVSSQQIVYLTNALLPYGYQVQVIYSRGEPKLRKLAYNRFVDSGCDAVIISGGFSKLDFPVLVPTVGISNSADSESLDNVVFIDYRTGVIEALDHLRDSGHQNIFLAAMYWSTFFTDQRKLAFDEYMQKLEPAAENIADRTLIFQKFEEITGQNISRFLEQHPDCTAFLCTNDLVAMKIIQALSEISLSVPEDFSVIGFDDIITADFFIPRLSSIRKPGEKIMEEAVKLLINKLENKNHSIKKSVPCHLIKRDSVAAAKKKEVIVNFSKEGVLK